MTTPAYRSGAASPTAETRIYSDLSDSLAPHPITGTPTTPENVDAVAQAVRNVVLTGRYERPYQRDLGDTISERLFELFGDPRVGEIRGVIRTALENHEPRAELLDVELLEGRDQNTLGIRVIFRPQGIADTSDIDVYLRRVR